GRDRPRGGPDRYQRPGRYSRPRCRVRARHPGTALLIGLAVLAGVAPTQGPIRVTSMEAWLLDESPGAYRYGEVDLPDPGPGEVWVSVVTSALNHLDLWIRKAMPKPPMFPMVPGCDGAGTVAVVGEGVTRWQVGDEVVINPSFACGRCVQCLS